MMSALATMANNSRGWWDRASGDGNSPHYYAIRYSVEYALGLLLEDGLDPLRINNRELYLVMGKAAARGFSQSHEIYCYSKYRDDVQFIAVRNYALVLPASFYGLKVAVHADDDSRPTASAFIYDGSKGLFELTECVPYCWSPRRTENPDDPIKVG